MHVVSCFGLVIASFSQIGRHAQVMVVAKVVTAVLLVATAVRLVVTMVLRAATAVLLLAMAVLSISAQTIQITDILYTGGGQGGYGGGGQY